MAGNDDAAEDGDQTVDSFIRRVARVETSSAAFERTIFIGSKIDRYEIVKRLGAGGMGIVYEARDTELERNVALKLVKPRGISIEDAQRRMRREAQAMAKLSSAYTVGIHDIGTHGDKVFIAMELLRGGTLRDWMREPHDWREVTELFLKLARGLSDAHSAGIVHRDFKPENVLLGGNGEVRIADFGLARSCGSIESVDGTPAKPVVPMQTASELAGTPAYMSPEQLQEAPTDVRTDQFSFAVAFYEALEGTRPFAAAGSDFTAIAAAVLEAQPRAWQKSVPRWLRETIAKGFARDPEQRWPSMDLMQRELELGLRRRSPWPLIVAGVLVVLAALAVLLALRV
ncbi:MAG: serine/threonine-protein kinase [Kofleriaceae bacterium]